jgi:hypothetical protein
MNNFAIKGLFSFLVIIFCYHKCNTPPTPQIIQAAPTIENFAAKDQHNEVEAQKDFTVLVSKVKTTLPEHKLKYLIRVNRINKMEAPKFGIPDEAASTVMALESAFGTNTLATEYNNPYSIKCHLKGNHKNHKNCVYHYDSDPSPDDYFVKYPTLWEGVRAFNILLSANKRYKKTLAAETVDETFKELSLSGYCHISYSKGRKLPDYYYLLKSVHGNIKKNLPDAAILREKGKKV